MELVESDVSLDGEWEELEISIREESSKIQIATNSLQENVKDQWDSAESLVAHIDRGVAAQWVTTICDSNPASPISRYSGEIVPSEVVPAGWWGGWVSQRATESLKLIFYLFANLRVE